MQNKKFGKYLAVSVLVACGLCACDDIEARPVANGDDVTMLAFKEGVEVYGNNYESINDGYHGDVAAKSLDDILYTYAINVVGAYNSTIAKTYASKVTKGGEAIDAAAMVTLKDVYEDNSKLAKFVEQHPAYNVGDDAAKLNFVKARYEAMNKSIAKKMFAKIAAATEDNKFNEKELLISIYNNGGKVTNPYGNDAALATLTKDKIVKPENKPENVFTDGILHMEVYSSDKNTFIEDEILPDIYKDALVQQYIFEEQPKTLGSSSARNVNFVSIKYEGLEQSLYAEKLVKSFVKDYLLTDKNTNTLAAFNSLSKVWNGEFVNYATDNADYKDAYDLLTAMNFDINAEGVVKSKTIGADTYKYVDKSAFGELVEDYAKLDPNPAKSNASKDYTGGNKYAAKIGFNLEKEKIALNNSVTNGWFIKSSSEVSSLPDSVKNRLFNLSVATGKNNGSAAALEYKDSKWTIGTSNKYLAKNGNNYFLRGNNLKANQEDYEAIIFNDTNAHTYYIVNVVDAVSANFMSTDAATSNYDLKINVASLLSSNDTNVTLSKKHWLEKCEIKYHDQSVYDYFVSNFPDMFDED